jgi:hypothetical protein
MQNMVYQSLSISILFLVFKVVETKIAGEKEIPFKEIMKQTFIVLLSSVGGLFILDQLKSYIHTSPLLDVDTKPVVFTDNPNF